MNAPSLRELQGLFWEAIASAPGEARPAESLLRVIDAGTGLVPVERVAIYADMYWSRIHDVLRGDFARTAELLGDATFTRVAREYLRTRPSRDPSIARVGEGFADHLAQQAALPRHAADLARLEWARGEAFVAPAAIPLRLEDLSALPPEAWPDLRLTLVPSAQVLELAWPVQRLLDERNEASLTAAPTMLRVWRRGEQVFHATVDAAEQGALRILLRRDGATFGAISDACGDAPQAAAIFARWLEDELVMLAVAL